MPYVNHHTVVGHLGADAKFTLLKSGKVVVNFDVAATRHSTKPSGDRCAVTSWFAVKLFTTSKGEAYFEPKLKKGTLVYVDGEHLIDAVVNDDGSKKKFPHIKADKIDVLTPKAPAVDPDERPVDYNEDPEQPAKPRPWPLPRRAAPPAAAPAPPRAAPAPQSAPAPRCAPAPQPSQSANGGGVFNSPDW